MLRINLKELSTVDVQNYLQHAVAPRPICLASTIDNDGNINLSPFSFFNIFSSNPPIVIFSPAKRVRDNTAKHTLENVLEHPEVVINIVDYDMVQQTNLSSCEYAKEINEFTKAGFTMQPAFIVQPPMVRESKIKLECKVIEVKPLGNEGGAGNLIICEVLIMHIDENILDDEGKIDQEKINHAARLGGDWYCQVNKHNLFKVEKPDRHTAIGFDALPESIINSRFFSKNQLAILANVAPIPAIDRSFEDQELNIITKNNNGNELEMKSKIFAYAGRLINENKAHQAWQILLQALE